MEDYGIKISELGYDVETADDMNLLLKSDFRLLKVALSGSINLVDEWTEIAHNLGYVPQFLVYIKDLYWNPPIGRVFLGTADWEHMARADANKIYISKAFYPETSSAYYYIFYEGA